LSDAERASVRKLNRNLAITGSVVLFHIAALWALQSGLLRRPAESVVLVQLVELITPAAPRIEPPPAPAPPPPEPARQAVQRKAERVIPPQPRPASVPEARPAPQRRPAIESRPPSAPEARPAAETRPPAEAEPAPETRQVTEFPTGPVTPEAPATAPPAAAAPAPPAPAAAPAQVELPSSGASYLQNPPPIYPLISKRLGEQGKVVVRVLIGADGRPQKAELARSSGYERLDRSALDYVMKCRYVPGKVGGVPQAMWYEAPVSFVLE
jgi:periplasmic protein TonB